jgi:hypothetical protein
VFRALIRCAVFAVLGLDALIIALYYAGFPRDNSGGRPTAEQPAPAQSILAVSVLLVVSALCGAFADLWYAARFKKAAPLAGCAGYLILAVLGIALTMAAGFIRSIAEGNLPAGAP